MQVEQRESQNWWAFFTRNENDLVVFAWWVLFKGFLVIILVLDVIPSDNLIRLSVLNEPRFN